jgi:hypothetical protein
VRLTDKLFLTGSYSTQVAGHSIIDPRPLDLVNFLHETARIQFGGLDSSTKRNAVEFVCCTRRRNNRPVSGALCVRVAA